MGKLVFQTDDPELLDFVYSLGRERSKVICALLRECMEEGGGYIPPRIMAVTGFSYKNKKAIKKTGTAITSKQKKSPKQKLLYKEKTVSEPVPVEKVEEQEAVIPKEPEVIKEPVPVEIEQNTETGDEESYVSSAPKIQNAGLVMAQLSAFGGM